MAQTLLTLHFLHEKHVVHRDIKLHNILINKIDQGEYNIKIADFGMATFSQPSNNGELYVKCGTPGFVAPEILRSEGYNNKVDIFSLGVVFYNLLTGYHLFIGDTVNEILASNKICDIADDLEILVP
jgi:serine/threonine protein kinase